jgi:hypothetical protein
MKNLLKKLTPGQRRKRSGTCDNRWLGWAQSLADRHSRIAVNHRGSSLTFMHPATTLPLYCEQWRRAAWTITPQINLSIGPILRLFQRAHGREASNEHRTERHRAPLEYPVTNTQAFIVERRSSTWQRPLQRVFAFAMFEEAGEARPVSRARHETLPVERSLQVVRRVVDERRRVEEPTRRTLVAREHRSMPRIEAAVAPETVMQSPRGLRVGAQGMMQTTAPSIDINQLTDRVVRNIDSRIIAHRERMGRLF